jgi:PAS domain S-box-containing protein
MLNSLLQTLVFDHYVTHPSYSLLTLTCSGQILDASSNAAQFTGRHHDALTGMSLTCLFRADHHLIVERAIQVAARGDTATLNAPIEGRSGWCEVNLSRLAVEHDQIILVALLREVGDIHGAAESARQAQARYAGLQDAVSDAVITIRPDGRVAEWNRAAERTFGYTRAEAVGQMMADLIIPVRERSRHAAGLRQQQRTGEGKFVGRTTELSALHKDGHEFPVELSLIRVEVDGHTCYTAFMRELTVQRATLQQVQAQSEYLHLVQSQLPSIFWTTDRDLTLISASGGHLTPLGIDLSAFLGRPIAEILSGTSAEHSGVEAHEVALQGRSSAYTLALQHLHYQVQVRPFRDPAGEIMGVVALATDVTVQVQQQQLDVQRAAILESIARSEPIETTLERLIQLVSQQIQGSMVHILQIEGQELRTLPGSAVPPILKSLLDRASDRIALWQQAPLPAAMQQYRAAHMPDPAWREALERSGLTGLWVMPVRSQVKGLAGLIVVYRVDDQTPPPWAEGVLQEAARLLMVALEQHKSLQTIIQTKELTLRTLGLALEYRDYETKGHTERVTRLSLKLGRALGLTSDQLDDLRRGAYLHDVGKIAVPDQILLKPDRLTPDEWEVIRQHPLTGYRLLEPLPSLSRETLGVVLHHHEHWDGGGYPEGLAGESIPLLARVFAVVDTFDALTSQRPYKSAWTVSDALVELHRMAGRVLDPRIVTLFVALMQD